MIPFIQHIFTMYFYCLNNVCIWLTEYKLYHNITYRTHSLPLPPSHGATQRTWSKLSSHIPTHCLSIWASLNEQVDCLQLSTSLKLEQYICYMDLMAELSLTIDDIVCDKKLCPILYHCCNKQYIKILCLL